MTPETLKASLSALQSEEQPVRTAALNVLRTLPRHELAQAWAQHRAVEVPDGWFLDPFARVRIRHPDAPVVAKRGIAVAFTPGYAGLTEGLLQTLVRSGNCEGVALLVFSINSARLSFAVEQEIERAGMSLHYIECLAVERLATWVKTAMYAVAYSPQIQVESILCLESDTLVVGSLAPLWTALEVAHPTAIMGCRSQALPLRISLSEVLTRCNRPQSDLAWMLGVPNFDAPFWFNGGVLAGRRAAWAELDARLRALFPFNAAWIEGFTWYYGEEFVMNVGVSLMENRVELSPLWNVQFVKSEVAENVTPLISEDGMSYQVGHDRARLLHLVSDARQHHASLVRDITRMGLAPDVSQQVAHSDPKRLSPFSVCRVCGLRRTCGCFYEPSTYAAERRASGERSAICVVCVGRSEGQSEEQIRKEHADVAAEIFAFQQEQTARAFWGEGTTSTNEAAP